MTNPHAVEILKLAKAYGFKVSVRGSILTVSRSFTPGDLDAFRDCDMMVGSVLDALPSTSPGSVWGTDGGSVGGASAVKSGNFVMNKSGGSKRVLEALKKLLGSQQN